MLLYAHVYIVLYLLDPCILSSPREIILQRIAKTNLAFLTNEFEVWA